MALNLVSRTKNSDIVPDFPPSLDEVSNRGAFQAILGGAVLFLAFGFTFSLIGTAIGLPISRLLDPLSGGALKVTCFIYHLAAFSIAFLIGGFCSSRLANAQNPSSGAFCGLMSWALGGLFALGLGIFFSLRLKDILSGEGPSVANWFIVLVALLGGVSATQGGSIGCEDLDDLLQPPSAEDDYKIAS